MSGVIKVENLGKKYIIGHQKQRGGATLRDTMTHTARGIWQRVRHPLSPNRESIDLEELWALKDVNFEVQQGERLGIIGPNGAGKSTLLKILSRITEPTTGKVRIKGRVSSLLEVGTGFHPELTGRENIFLNGAILGMTQWEIRQKFDEIVAFSELEKFLDTPVKRYSSGMYVRLAFAIAAHLEPKILIVDEVLAVGDASFQKKCLGKMGEVAGEGRTVLFVSHNMVAVKKLCPRAVLLDKGRIARTGTTAEVVNTYINTGHRQKAGQDISPEMHSHYPPPLEVYRVEILNSKERINDTLLIDEFFSIRLFYRIRDPQRSYRIGVMFRSQDEVPLASTTCADGGKPFLKGKQDEQYSILLKVQNVLVAGNYALDVVTRQTDLKIVDTVSKINLTVAPVSVGAPNYGGGCVRIRPEWSRPEKI